MNEMSMHMNGRTTEPLSVYRALWVKVGALIFILVALYWETFASFARTWAGRDDYSHGFVVPLVSIYFAYAMKDKLAAIPVRPRPLLGMAVITFAALMLVLGSVGSVVMVQQMSILVMAPGLVLALLGYGFLKGLALPLAYLVLMVPAVLDTAMSPLHWPFQLFGAAVASWLINLVGIPVFRTAQFLELPNITLEVANVCSGVRYLVSILAISIPLSFFTQRTLLRRVLLILFGLMVGIIVNPLRIMLISLWTYHGGEGVHGPSHLLHGLFVSQVGFALLFAGAWALARMPGSDMIDHKKKGKSKILDSVDIVRLNKTVIITMVVLLGSASIYYLYKPKPVPLDVSADTIPLQLGTWRGQDMNENLLYDPRGADYQIRRIYRRSDNTEIYLSVVYFESQRQGKEMIHYSLSKYYNDAIEISVPVATDKYITVNKTLAPQSGHKAIVLYLYNLNGQFIADRHKVKLMTAVNGLLHRRTNGAKIMISRMLINGQSPDSALNDETEFFRELYPHLTMLLQRTE